MTMMNESQSALWQKLASFNLNDGNETFTFEMRLARENRWTPAFTLRVVEEYRRFLFLCFEAGHPCSPSDAVDQIWHLHLTYTRSYWERLCGEVLPGPLHHEPTKGGAAETEKFDDWYERTLDAYRRLFGCEPPIDIWPPTSIRFIKPEPRTTELWTIPKARAKRAFAFSAVLALIAAAGCEAGTDSDLAWPLAALLLLLGVFVAFAISQLKSYGRRTPGGDGGSGGGFDWIIFGDSGGSDGGHSHGGHGSHDGHGGGGDHGGGGHGCGGHGCGGHGCGGHGCGSGCGGGGH